VNHNDYIFSNADGQFSFLRRFEEMYRNCDDPHGQSKELERTDYQLVSVVLGNLLRIRKKNSRVVRVLDVGCGLGYFTSHINRLCPDGKVSGCDISATAIAKARLNAPECDFFSANLQDRDSLPQATFDLLVALDVLYYFTEHEILSVVKNLRDLLDPAGHILVGYHLPSTMIFGRFITCLDDAKRLFESNGFIINFSMDVENHLDTTYSGDPVGRHLYFLAKRKSTE
jgi:SAM-dependent methyltransferase